MARNYKFSEAVEIINEGKDLEAIADIGRRFPILAHKVAVVTAKAGEDFVDLMKFMPEYLTAGKVNSVIKNGAAVNDEDDGNDVEAPSDIPEAEDGDVMPDYSSMSGKALWDILGKAGARKNAKSTKKPDLVAACEELWNKQHSGAASEEDEEANDPYAGKTAMELFKMCKQRKIKAEPKQKAKYYADLLKNADSEAAAEDDNSDSDSWDEDDVEEAPKKVKKEKKAKEEAKEKASDDDDDDWDI